MNRDVFSGLTPQPQMPIFNLFGDTQWTYLGQQQNQETALHTEPVYVDDGIPIEMVRAYAMLTMQAGKGYGARDMPLNALITLAIAYFVPSWVLLPLMGMLVIGIFIAQRRYRRALALADQFYDLTIYRYTRGASPEFASRTDSVRRVIDLR